MKTMDDYYYHDDIHINDSEDYDDYINLNDTEVYDDYINLDDSDDYDIYIDTGDLEDYIAPKSKTKKSAVNINIEKKEKVSITVPKKEKVKKRAKHFKNGVIYDWHYFKSINDTLIQFFEKHARQPDLKAANSVHKNIIDAMQLKLKEDGFMQNLQYVGSSYEGLKVGRKLNQEMDDLEYDIMFFLEKGLVIKKEIPGIKTHIYIVPANEDAKQKLLDVLELGYVSPTKVASKFYKKLENCINDLKNENLTNESVELKHIKEISVLRNHGPAIQLDVYKDSLDHFLNLDSNQKPKPTTQKHKFYSVDLVPTFEISLDDLKVEHYVAKPMKYDETIRDVDFHLTWRRSFSVEEKKILINIDEKNCCRKKVLRIIKVFRLNEPALHKLTSYHLKTVLLHLVNQKPDDDDWADKNMLLRFIDYLKLLRDMLEKKDMPHFFLQDYNLLNTFTLDNMDNMKNRFRRMINSKKLMETLLK